VLMDHREQHRSLLVSARCCLGHHHGAPTL
jgi:hypothetical protein